MISIRYLNAPALAVEQFGDTFGDVYFDTSEGMELRLTKALDVYDDTQQVRQEAALGDSLPASPRNLMLLDGYMGDTLDRETDALKVEVRINGEIQPIGEMLVVGYSASDQAIEIDLYGSDWVEDLERTLLHDLDLGTFDWTIANIASAWSTDRDSLVKPLLAHFGGWLSTSEVIRRDMRLAFNLGKLLKQTLCAIGWELVSPYWLVGDGQHQYAYLGGDDWYSYDDKRDSSYVELEVVPTSMDGTETLLPLNAVYDPNGLWNSALRPLEYFYPIIHDTPTTLKIEIRNLSLLLPAIAGSVPAEFYILTYKNDNGSLAFVDFQRFPGSNDVDIETTLNVDIYDDDATNGDSYAFYVGYTTFSDPVVEAAFELRGGDVYFRPDPPWLADDDSIQVAGTIDSKLTGKDLLLAMSHIMNGKVLTDYGNRRVYLLTPNDHEALEDGNEIEGFFQRDRKAIDLTGVSRLQNMRIESNDQNRFVELGFDVDDEYFNDQFSTPTRYNYRADRGIGQPDTDEILNPLFTGTIDIEADSADVGGNGIIIPALWDNTDGKISGSLSPRIFTFYGEIEQTTSASVAASWVLEGVAKSDVPYFSQLPLIELPGTVELIPITFKGYRDSLFRFYSSEMQETSDSIVYEFTVNGGEANYENIDFRRIVLVNGTGAQWAIQPIYVRDYVVGTESFILGGRIIKC